MNVSTTIKAAQKCAIIRCVVIWNPFTSRALFAGQPAEIPKPIRDKHVKSYRYDKEKQRLIMRVQA